MGKIYTQNKSVHGLITREIVPDYEPLIGEFDLCK